MVDVIMIFGLLVAFQIKHYVCDYTLQTPYMLGKFKEEGWIFPLAAHCGVHAIATAGIALVTLSLFSPTPMWAILYFSTILCVTDFSLHFIMDRIKASPRMLGKYTVQERKFWLSLGKDQTFHHLTHYLLIFWLICIVS